MIDTVSKIKPSVRQLQAYTLRHFEAQVKINQNENPYDMSGVYTGDLLKAVKLLGAKAILEKPFEPDKLVAVVDKILGKNGK